MNHRFNVSAYVSVYIYAQAFSASLKRSLNLSANEYYYYYLVMREIMQVAFVHCQLVPESLEPEV